MTLITECVGNIFSAPPGSVLIHACNAQGAWGSGVAKAFKQQYPHAYTIYRNHCLQPPPNTKLLTHQTCLVGTTLLIPPLPALKNKSKTSAEGKGCKGHWVACLFTSHGYGIHRSKPDVILNHTAHAVRYLRGQLNELREGKKLGEKEGVAAVNVNGNGNGNGVENEKGKEGEKGEDEVGIPGKCYAVRINSGKFGVPWEDTKKVLEVGGVDMVVLRPEGDEEDVQEQVKESVISGGRRENASAKRKVGDEGVDGDGEVKGHAGLAKRRKEK